MDAFKRKMNFALLHRRMSFAAAGLLFAGCSTTDTKDVNLDPGKDFWIDQQADYYQKNAPNRIPDRDAAERAAEADYNALPPSRRPN